MTCAVAVHFVVFAFFPRMGVADLSVSSEELNLLDYMPPPIVPPAPERLTRPADPVMSEIASPDAVIATIGEVWDAPPELPAAPRIGGDPSRQPVWTPRTVNPRLLNTNEVQRALERLYPAMLRDAGIGGTVTVWFYVDEAGRVIRTQVQTGSEHEAFDRAALDVAKLMEFAPAYNRDRPVAVWVAIPIRFTARVR